MTTGEALFIEGKIDEAYDVLLQEAEEGNGRAMYLLGEYAKHAWLFPVDIKKAGAYAKAGKAAGDLLADFNVGYTLKRHSKIQKAYLAERLPALEALAKSGDVLAIWELVDVYSMGLIREVDVRKEWELNNMCADAGFWSGRTRMASLYLWADGVMADWQDTEKGIAVLKEMVEENKKFSGEAACLLADYYLYTGDMKTSFLYSKAAAEWGNSGGYFFLARHYMLGEAVKQDFSRAIELFKKNYDFQYEYAGDSAAYTGDIYMALLDAKNAVRWYKRGAKIKNSGALLGLGVCYENGIGVTEDEEKALDCYEKAYGRNTYVRLEAACRMAELLAGKDKERAKALALEAAEGGHREAMLFLIRYYSEIEEDPEQAIHWAKIYYEKAEETDLHRAGVADLIAAYSERLGNLEESLRWAKIAAELGEASAMYQYAHLKYIRGTDNEDLIEAQEWFLRYIEEISKDEENEERNKALGDAYNLYAMCYIRLSDVDNALPWFEKAVEYGDPYGMMNLGGIYLGLADVDEEKLEKAIDCFLAARKAGKDSFDDSARGIVNGQLAVAYRKKEDWDNSFYWANKAASYQSEVGMIELGMLYSKGFGTVKDMDKAIQWLTAAYHLKGPQQADAANFLGLFYEERKDFKNAGEWFEKSANLGNEWAMYNLGCHYENGDITEDTQPDYRKAIEWYEKALAKEGETTKDAQDGIIRCRAALGEFEREAEMDAPSATNLKQLYMPWLSTMKWGGGK